MRFWHWLTGAGASAPVSVSDVPHGTNRVPGTIFHLGDGRRLAFGESAEMTLEIAAALARHNETPA